MDLGEERRWSKDCGSISQGAGGGAQDQGRVTPLTLQHPDGSPLPWNNPALPMRPERPCRARPHLRHTFTCSLTHLFTVSIIQDFLLNTCCVSGTVLGTVLEIALDIEEYGSQQTEAPYVLAEQTVYKVTEKAHPSESGAKTRWGEERTDANWSWQVSHGLLRTHEGTKEPWGEQEYQGKGPENAARPCA